MLSSIHRLRRRRGYALLLVVIVLSMMMTLAGTFLLSINDDHKESVIFRQAGRVNQYALMGVHRVMAELMHDVWGVVSAMLPFTRTVSSPSAAVCPARQDARSMRPD